MVIGGSNVFSHLQGDFSFSGLGEKTQSTEFSSGKSDSKFFFFSNKHLISISATNYQRASN